MSKQFVASALTHSQNMMDINPLSSYISMPSFKYLNTMISRNPMENSLWEIPQNTASYLTLAQFDRSTASAVLMNNAHINMQQKLYHSLKVYCVTKYQNTDLLTSI